MSPDNTRARQQYDTLRLAAGELRRRPMEQSSETDAFEQFFGAGYTVLGESCTPGLLVNLVIQLGLKFGDDPVDLIV